MEFLEVINFFIFYFIFLIYLIIFFIVKNENGFVLLNNFIEVNAPLEKTRMKALELKSNPLILSSDKGKKKK
jgi:ABC-type uncharacterized transport system permease subunit